MPDSQFIVGDGVRLISRPDLVGKVTQDPRRIGGEYWYAIYFGPGHTSKHPESDLQACRVTSDVKELLLQGQFAGREAFSKLLTHLKLTTALRSQVYALVSSRTKFYGYQFKPVLKFVESENHRLLIADEVGLGKTIEAGLILTELRARRPLNRVLIVPPAHLCTKWQRELKTRFDLDFEILDREGIERFLREYDEEGDDAVLHGIVPLQTMRSRTLMTRWEAASPQLDMVIFDEAGRLRNSETQSNRTSVLIGETSDALLLLTATPVQTGTQDLYHLMRILDSEEFADVGVFNDRLVSNEPILRALAELRRKFPPDLAQCKQILQGIDHVPFGERFARNPLYNRVVARFGEATVPTRREVVELQRDLSALNVLGHLLSRTRKRDVHEHRPVRRSQVVRTPPTQDEERFYKLVTRICRDMYKRVSRNTMTGFHTIMPQRQMASCMVAMVEYLQTRGGQQYVGTEASDFVAEDFELEEGNEESVVTWDALGDLETWKKRLAENDTKWASLLRVIEEVGRKRHDKSKILVFSYFKKTLRYLQSRLEATDIKSLVIDGDVPSKPSNPDEDIRGQRLEQFRSDASVRVLLSSEVGSEGLDLEFCHVVVNYDLPWNPMVVEQRIGRLDRIGQQSKSILIFNLSMPGTIEDRVLDRLYARVKVFESSIGDLEVILGEEIRSLAQAVFSEELTPEELDARLDQSATVIERRKIEIEDLERSASSFIGHDEYFLDQIELARRQHRYVGGEELLVYVREFIHAHYSGCSIEPAGMEGVYLFHFDEPFRSFLRSALLPEDLGLRGFYRRAKRDEVQFTINQELADANKGLDFLTFYHPVVRAIKSYYTEHEEELFPASSLRMDHPSIPTGDYVWFLFLTEITGAHPYKDLEAVVLPMASGQALSADESESLLWELIQKGHSDNRLERPVISEDLVNEAEEVLIQRLEAKFHDRQRVNESIVEQRLASLEETFQRTLRKREWQLHQSRIRGHQDRIIRMREGGIKNLKSDYTKKKYDIEAGRRLGRSYELRGAGLLHIGQ
jgi:SNF2 family DNA or RNA helicase